MKDTILILESFVDATNSKIRAVNGYSRKLRGHVKRLYDHVLQVADEIPPPVNLSHESFKTNPLINSLFAKNTDIDRLFKSRLSNVDYLFSQKQVKTQTMYAILTAFKHEKLTLGVGLQGNILVRELPQQSVNFASHTLHATCAKRAELNEALKSYIFERVAMDIKHEMALRITTESHRTGKNTYLAHVTSLANPDVYLSAVIERLKFPEHLVRIEKVHFKLNKMGIKLVDDDNQYANEFDIHEITWGDNTRNVLLQIAFNPL
jgi:hypothetical protein